jgi:hypothetical protein
LQNPGVVHGANRREWSDECRWLRPAKASGQNLFDLGLAFRESLSISFFAFSVVRWGAKRQIPARWSHPSASAVKRLGCRRATRAAWMRFAAAQSESRSSSTQATATRRRAGRMPLASFGKFTISRSRPLGRDRRFGRGLISTGAASMRRGAKSCQRAAAEAATRNSNLPALCCPEAPYANPSGGAKYPRAGIVCPATRA